MDQNPREMSFLEPPCRYGLTGLFMRTRQCNISELSQRNIFHDVTFFEPLTLANSLVLSARPKDLFYFPRRRPLLVTVQVHADCSALAASTSNTTAPFSWAFVFWVWINPTDAHYVGFPIDLAWSPYFVSTMSFKKKLGQNVNQPLILWPDHEEK